MAQKNAVARRGPSAAQRAQRALASLKKMKTEIAQSKIPNALVTGGLVVGGACAAGGLKAALGRDEIAGVDLGVVGGIVSGTAGAALGQPWLISLGAGMLAPYAHDWVRDSVEDLMARRNEAPLRAVEG